MLRLSLVLAVIAGSILSEGYAQPVIQRPGYAAALVASGMTANTEDLAVDRLGDVYFIEVQYNQWTTLGRIGPTGVPTPAPGPGQSFGMATSPTDGLVYLHCYMHHFSSLGGVYRIDSGNIFTKVLASQGDSIMDIAVDLEGRLLLNNAGGIYRYESASWTGLCSVTYWDRIDILASGDLLISTETSVTRFDETSGTLVPFHTPSSPTAKIQSVERSPGNALGAGALVLTADYDSVSATGVFTCTWVDLNGGSPLVLATSSYGGIDSQCRIARDLRGGLYWMQSDPVAPSTQANLYRIFPTPSAGAPGSLLATLLPGTLKLSVQGPPPGGDAFLLGAIADSVQPLPELFLPVYGLLEIDPNHPAYAAAIDGIGLFGPPHPTGITPTGGLATSFIPIPPGLSGLGFVTQFLMLSPQAPNATFYVSNLAGFVLP